ncbi:hypothetical protein PFISCL1PPCAC_14208, partial [Pristionchus fissidentatus]
GPIPKKTQTAAVGVARRGDAVDESATDATATPAAAAAAAAPQIDPPPPTTPTSAASDTTAARDVKRRHPGVLACRSRGDGVDDAAPAADAAHAASNETRSATGAATAAASANNAVEDDDVILLNDETKQPNDEKTEGVKRIPKQKRRTMKVEVVDLTDDPETNHTPAPTKKRRGGKTSARVPKNKKVKVEPSDLWSDIDDQPTTSTAPIILKKKNKRPRLTRKEKLASARMSEWGKAVADQKERLLNVDESADELVPIFSITEKGSKLKTWKQINDFCETNRQYNDLLRKAYPDAVKPIWELLPDSGIDEEVYTKSDEGAAYWDKIADATGETSFPTDYIVCGSPRGCGNGKESIFILIKYKGYAVPCWEPYGLNKDVDTVYEFDKRNRLLDLIEFRLKQEVGGRRNFERLYGQRYLMYEKGAGKGGYVKNERALYKNRLRALEWRWNFVNHLEGLPPVYIEDWTNKPPSDEEIRALEFLVRMQPSKKVQRMLKKAGKQAGHIECGSSCKSCHHSNTSNIKIKCCGAMKMIGEDKETGRPRFVGEKNVGPRSNFFMHYECTEECDCDSTKCKNRLLQNGRQVITVVFRDVTKGWVLRTVAELRPFDFIGVYSGEVDVGSSAGKEAQAYDFEMSSGRIVKGEEEEPLIIKAYGKGNETRYISHSCEPNCRIHMVVLDRAASWYHHPCFLASRKIFAGEELSFDYFGDKRNDLKKCLAYFPHCLCQSAKCRYPKSTMKQLKMGVVEENGKEKEGTGVRSKIAESDGSTVDARDSSVKRMPITTADVESALQEMGRGCRQRRPSRMMEEDGENASLVFSSSRKRRMSNGKKREGGMNGDEKEFDDYRKTDSGSAQKKRGRPRKIKVEDVKDALRKVNQKTGRKKARMVEVDGQGTVEEEERREEVIERNEEEEEEENEKENAAPVGSGVMYPDIMRGRSEERDDDAGENAGPSMRG